MRILSERYGVSINAIRKVVHNETWKCDEYAERFVDHPVHWKRCFNGYLECSRKPMSMYDALQKAKSDPEALQQFFLEYGK